MSGHGRSDDDASGAGGHGAPPPSPAVLRSASPAAQDVRFDRIAGVLLGTAAGDALGLPREGLPPDRARRRFGDDVRHAFFAGYGMLSDDTEHACLVAQSLLAAPHDPRAFASQLAWRLRLWMLALPAGVGLATARAIGRLWLGWDPAASGVWSAGNGPAMRSALLGLCHGGDAGRLRHWVAVSTAVTHTDPRAERAAFLVAFAAAYGAARAPGAVRYDEFLPAALAAFEASGDEPDDELRAILASMHWHLHRSATAAEFAAALHVPRGVTGYAYHTVPAALYAWLRHPGDFRAAVAGAIRLGGDADTVGAITGAISGAAVGAGRIPGEWIAGLADLPRSVAWIRTLADRVACAFPADGTPGAAGGPLPLAWWLVPPRNAVFLALVLGHGIRRLFPPY